MEKKAGPSCVLIPAFSPIHQQVIDSFHLFESQSRETRSTDPGSKVSQMQRGYDAARPGRRMYTVHLSALLIADV